MILLGGIGAVKQNRAWGRASPQAWSAVRLCNLAVQGPGAPKEEFKREVDRQLIGQETESWKVPYVKAYKGADCQ